MYDSIRISDIYSKSFAKFLAAFFGTVIHCWRYWAARVADVTQAFQVDTRRRLARNGDLMGMLA
jgi:hypothetical protein